MNKKSAIKKKISLGDRKICHFYEDGSMDILAPSREPLHLNPKQAQALYGILGENLEETLDDPDNQFDPEFVKAMESLQRESGFKPLSELNLNDLIYKGRDDNEKSIHE